jgi:hypothetical protein
VIDGVRSKLSYANVMATLAVFISLGGTSYATLQVTGHDVRDGSLTGRDLRRNSLGGRPIKESRLDVVPHARNADRLDGVTAARLFIRCPARTVPVSDVCVEESPRPAVPYTAAAVACESFDRRRTPGRRLPSHDELMTAIGDLGITLAEGGELTRNVYPSATDPGGLDILVVADPGGRVALTSNTPVGAKAFRCVTDPLN